MTLLIASEVLTIDSSATVEAATMVEGLAANKFNLIKLAHLGNK